MKECILCK